MKFTKTRCHKEEVSICEACNDDIDGCDCCGNVFDTDSEVFCDEEEYGHYCADCVSRKKNPTPKQGGEVR